MSAAARSSVLTRRLVLGAVVVVLLLIVVLDTTYLSPAEVKKLNPPPFNATTYGVKTFPRIAARVSKDATNVTVLAPAVAKGLPAAGKRYGHDLGSGNYSFPIKATGVATQVDSSFVLLKVKGVPPGTQVRIPLGQAVNGTPVRDATGTITYGDFSDQTDYQSAANQFKLRIEKDILAKLDVKSLKGKTVSVEGGWSTGGPPKSFIIQPTKLAVGS